MNQGDIDSLLGGSFELDCPNIQLIPTAPDSKRPELRGSGLIAVNKKGHFDLKVYIQQVLPIDEVFERLNWDPGKLIGDEFYYDLVAHDFSGNIWRANRFLIDRSTGPNGSIISARIPSIHTVEESSGNTDKHYVKLIYNRQINVPLNTIVREEETVGDSTRKLNARLGLAKFNLQGIEFEVNPASGRTVFSASSEKVELTNTIIQRMLGAFAFVSAHPDEWSIMVTTKNGETKYSLQAIEDAKPSSRVAPPISLQSHEVWQLFEKFYIYTAINKNNRFHPLSRSVHSVLESGRTALDVQALVLSVSIETLLTSEFKHLYKLDDKIKSYATVLSQRVSNSKVYSDGFKNRVKGFLSSMNSARAKDLLITLRDSGMIDKDLVKTYGEIRNKTAHGAIENTLDIQNFFNKTNAVLVLYYHLIFLVIGYQGPYTDYGTYKYPSKYFDSKMP